MISVYQLKPKFQALIRPIAVLLNKWDVSPNAVTISAVILSAIMGYALLKYETNSWFLLLVAFGYLLRMMLNALDGIIAKEFNKQSTRGEILNEIGDVVSDIFIYLGLIAIPSIHLILLIVFISMSTINEFSGVLAKSISGERTFHGPMGKSDRALVIGLFCITLFFFPVIAAYTNYLLIICSILMGLSSYKRLTIS